jgi:hypothetical protein
MRVFLLTAAVAWAYHPVFAQPGDVGGKPTGSRIVTVTVYQTSALVTRTVDVPEGAGTVELVVSPLPPETVPSSLYAEGTDGIRVLNSRFRTRAIREDTRDEVRKLQAQIKQLAQEAQRLQADIKTANENQQFLTKLEAFTGATMQHLTEKGLLNADTTIALAKYVMSSRVERSKEVVALQQQVQANNEQSEFAKRQLAELTSGVQRTERDAVIVVDKANAPAGMVRLNYLVGSVAWRPQYKLRAGKDKDPVSLEYLASVRQQTGEDWTGVALALSTAQPMLNASPPELKSLEVSAIAASAPNPMGIGQPGGGPGAMGGRSGKDVYKELQQRAGESRAQSQQLSNTLNWVEAGKVINEAAALEQFGDLMATRDEIVLAKRELGEAVNDGPSVTFRLRTKLTLPSRNDVQTLEVARIELAPEFFYKAVPVLTPHVYREATLTNKSDFVLLPGEATMYLGTDFVGRSELPLVAIGKQFTVGFGVDPQLQASRQLLNKTRTTTGGNQVLTFDYRILVNSYKTEPVRLQVWDRMPKAEAQAVAVNLVSQKPDVSTDPLYLREDRPKNLLRWDVTAQPTQNGEKALTIDYQFKLELDKNMQIGAVAAK